MSEPLGADDPARFRLRTWTVPAGEGIDYRPADWADALVIVEHGLLEVQCRGGSHARFAEGAILVLAAVPLRRLGNPGPQPLVLRALTRHR